MAGTGVTLSYSFPWTTSATATYSGHNGVGNYSSLNEQNATSHYGLSTTQQVAARAVLQAWANVANINFLEVAESSTNVGDIRFAWTSATDTTSTGGTAWGWANLPNSYWPSAGDIWISTASSGASHSDWSVGSFNFMSLLHEVGHALGLKHPFEGGLVLPAATDTTQYSVMSYTPAAHSLYVSVTHSGNSWSWSSYNIEPSTPMLYDMQAIQYLYGVNTSYNTGDNTYTFDPATPFIKTLWDAAGNDTISVSNFALACAIDLRQGSYSKISYFDDTSAPVTWTTAPPTPTYDGTDDLAIAYGCVIENAIGGSGNDSITGNDSNNSLTGGAGNDALYGGSGNDVFDSDASARGGNDIFYGGPGDDSFFFNSSLDSAVEYSGEGTDTVWVSFSYSIANLPNVENLRAAGAVGVSLAGNTANNFFSGSSGNDTITGGDGSDTILFTTTRTNCTITAIAGGFRVTSTADGTDTLASVEYAQFSDQTVNLYAMDITAPTVTTFSPVDGATAVAVASNIVVTFSESIARGVGSIALVNATGQVVESFNAATNARLSIAGSVLTINPTSDLGSSAQYWVQFAAGTINDLAGNHYAGTRNYSFTTVGTTFVGTGGDDVLLGGAGDDTINGGDGSDWLYGSAGSDSVRGDAGNDYLYGQTGGDVLDGGDGADIVSGGDGNDTLSGGNGDDGLYGDAGVDTMNGHGGGDFMAGGDDGDTLHGDDGQDWVYGEWGDDTLYGDAGNDFLFGNFGSDTLTGGLGSDTYFGGDGADTFFFAANQGEDFIMDFSLAQGDRICISSGTNGISTAAQALAHVHDSGANAVLDLGAGSYVMLMGVSTSALHATDFVIA